MIIKITTCLDHLPEDDQKLSKNTVVVIIIIIIIINIIMYIIFLYKLQWQSY
jgi:hypothetical protein